MLGDTPHLDKLIGPVKVLLDSYVNGEIHAVHLCYTRFINTMKITAYRAESAVVAILRKHLGHGDEARSLAKDIWTHPADLLPDPTTGTLTVRLHHFTNPQASRAVHELLIYLNSSRTYYPGTTLRLQYELVSSPIPGDQDP